METKACVLWRRLDRPGHEYAELIRQQPGWMLRGVALFDHERQPCRLEYQILCDETWSTVSAAVSGRVGRRDVDVKVSVNADRSWQLNGRDCPEVAGCIDVDLNFSPSTNLLPIRRLDLGLGQAAAVRAAWLRFPSFALEPLDQSYRRLAERTYRYESAGGKFVAELQVDPSGLPLQYAGLWAAESSA